MFIRNPQVGTSRVAYFPETGLRVPSVRASGFYRKSLDRLTSFAARLRKVA
jgi:hypothetical protein